MWKCGPFAVFFGDSPTLTGSHNKQLLCHLLFPTYASGSLLEFAQYRKLFHARIAVHYLVITSDVRSWRGTLRWFVAPGRAWVDEPWRALFQRLIIFSSSAVHAGDRYRLQGDSTYVDPTAGGFEGL